MLCPVGWCGCGCVAMVIPTIPRFAQCTVIWKMFQKSVLHKSRNHNDEIVIDAQFPWITSTIYCCMLFLIQLTRLCIWNIINFIENYRHIIYKTKLCNYLPFTHSCVHSLCRFSVTGIITTSQRRCHARDTPNRAYIFYNARFFATRFGNSLADVGFVMYQHELTDAIIGCKHDVPFIVRSEALGATRTRRVLTDPHGPFVLKSIYNTHVEAYSLPVTYHKRWPFIFNWPI